MTTTRTTKTLRAKTPTDLLACVPTLLGFHPEDSVVLVTAGSAGTPVHARIDLPSHAECLDEILDIVAELRDVARRHRLSRVAVVLYTDDHALASAVGAALAEELTGLGVEVVLVLRAEASRCFVHRRDGTAPEHDLGIAYSLADHPLTVESVVEGRVVHASRKALAASLDCVPSAVAEVCHAAGTHQGRLLRARTTPSPEPVESARRHLAVEARWLQGRVRRFLADHRSLDADDAGRLLVAMLSVEVRDVAWAEVRPETSRDCVDLWSDIVRRSPQGLLAAPAALLAFSAWQSGDGALAWCALDRCREADPGYSLALLVGQALAGSVPPSAWEPLDPALLSVLSTE